MKYIITCLFCIQILHLAKGQSSTFDDQVIESACNLPLDSFDALDYVQKEITIIRRNGQIITYLIETCNSEEIIMQIGKTSELYPYNAIMYDLIDSVYVGAYQCFNSSGSKRLNRPEVDQIFIEVEGKMMFDDQQESKPVSDTLKLDPGSITSFAVLTIKHIERDFTFRQQVYAIAPIIPRFDKNSGNFVNWKLLCWILIN